MNQETAKPLAVAMAVLCVRNTSIEDIHAGIEPYLPSGDFSDVKVVTPAGEIPWPKVSRIRDNEMRIFMKPVVDRLYTILLRLDDASSIGFTLFCRDRMMLSSSRASINTRAG
jgi:hypothetical protein